ncbi:MAG: AmmeMemoRadiSam system radical SAM enzyme [Gammaproteobacteria bacterium]
MSSTANARRFEAPTRYWHTLEDGRVQCDLCPRYCRLKEGQRGLCFVRACVDGAVVMTSYGRSSGFCIDPIEKKPLNHFYPGSPVLSFGTAGCNLACKFCQNWDISKSREMDTLADAAAPEAIAAAAAARGCTSVAYTYNDPVVYHEYAIDVAAACAERGVRSVAVTAGYVCAEPRVEFFERIDAVNVDLKAFSEDFYRRVAGGSLAPVLETLEYIRHETSAWLEITCLLIPGYNDAEGEVAKLVTWIAEHLGPDVPLHFSAFHPDWKMREVPPTPPETVQRARRQALAMGLHHVYTGNIVDPDGDRTVCAGCGELLIQRAWYDIEAYRLDAAGRCPRCASPCAGRFAERAGSWGRRREPLHAIGANA